MVDVAAPGQLAHQVRLDRGLGALVAGRGRETLHADGAILGAEKGAEERQSALLGLSTAPPRAATAAPPGKGQRREPVSPTRPEAPLGLGPTAPPRASSVISAAKRAATAAPPESPQTGEHVLLRIWTEFCFLGTAE